MITIPANDPSMNTSLCIDKVRRNTNGGTCIYHSRNRPALSIVHHPFACLGQCLHQHKIEIHMLGPTLKLDVQVELYTVHTDVWGELSHVAAYNHDFLCIISSLTYHLLLISYPRKRKENVLTWGCFAEGKIIPQIFTSPHFLPLVDSLLQ